MASHFLIPKSKKRLLIRKLQAEKIFSWGYANDNPQLLFDLFAQSGTATRCANRRASFISGRGFTNPAIYKLKVDDEGTTMDKLLQLMSKDYSMFSGMCVHVRYNGLGQIIERKHIPIMNTRLTYGSEIAVYDNWDRSSLLETYNVNKIIRYNRFNPAKAIEEILECEGKTFEDKVANYPGQVLWYSNNGQFNYPTSIADPVAEDIETDYQSKLYKNKNIRTSFTASGAFVDIGVLETSTDRNGTDNSQEERQGQLTEFQGAESAGNIMYVNVASKEDAPLWIPFSGDPNADKKFEYHENSVEKSIVKQFNLPLQLAGIETAGKLGGVNDLMEAYQVFNSETESDRIVMEEQVSKLLLQTVSIMPLLFSDVKNKVTGEDGPEVDAPNVSATALNGAQISSLNEIIANITTNVYPAPTGRAIIVASFPSLTDAQINDIINPLSNVTPQP